MKKLPRIGLMTCFSLLLAAASCEKKTVEPDVNDSCTACAESFNKVVSPFEVKELTKLKVYLMDLNKNYPEGGYNWIIRSKEDVSISSALPCTFPQSLLIEGKEVIIDGKFKYFDLSKYRGANTGQICISKIY